MRKGRLFRLVVISLGVLQPSCDYYVAKVSPIQARSEFQRLFVTVLGPKCVTCHQPEKEAGEVVDLSNYDSIMDSGVVVPGEPEESALYQQTFGCTMPKGGPKLPPNEIRQIGNWIANGANEF